MQNFHIYIELKIKIGSTNLNIYKKDFAINFPVYKLCNESRRSFRSLKP